MEFIKSIIKANREPFHYYILLIIYETMRAQLRTEQNRFVCIVCETLNSYCFWRLIYFATGCQSSILPSDISWDIKENDKQLERRTIWLIRLANEKIKSNRYLLSILCYWQLKIRWPSIKTYFQLHSNWNWGSLTRYVGILSDKWHCGGVEINEKKIFNYQCCTENHETTTERLPKPIFILQAQAIDQITCEIEFEIEIRS